MYIQTLFLPLAASLQIPFSTSKQNPLSTNHHLLSNPPPESPLSLKIPTSYESAIQARRILHLTPLGTLSTTFPTSSKDLENRPADVGGLPIGLMDYIADCESTGNPTILAINIATSFKNVAAGSNISLSLQWTPPHTTDTMRKPVREGGSWYSAANLPRFALLGYLEKIPEEEIESQELGKCFVKTHRDAKYWLPGNSIHESEFVRLVVQDVYWIGGFGDRAYIGWIPVEEWRSVTKKEIDGITLPGEQESRRACRP